MLKQEEWMEIRQLRKQALMRSIRQQCVEGIIPAEILQIPNSREARRALVRHNKAKSQNCLQQLQLIYLKYK